VADFAAPVPLIAKKWDANITAFSSLFAILLAGVFSISG
jgi:hypothetical protein